jgi:hypothetical protein
LDQRPHADKALEIDPGNADAYVTSSLVLFKAEQEPQEEHPDRSAETPMEDSMCKSMATIAATLAILPLGSVVPAQAGGGATERRPASGRLLR